MKKILFIFSVLMLSISSHSACTDLNKLQKNMSLENSTNWALDCKNLVIISGNFVYYDGFILNTSFCYTSKRCNLSDTTAIKCNNNPSAEGCPCYDDKQRCQKDFAGAKWSGSLIDGVCASTCDICNTDRVNDARDRFKEKCCENGVAPLNNITMCSTPLQSGTGMTVSNLNFDCNWQSNALTSAYCSDLNSSSSSEISSSSSSSDGEGDSSSSGDGDGDSSSSGDGDGDGDSSSSGDGGDSSSSGDDGGWSSSSGVGGGGNDTIIGGWEDWEYNYYPEFAQITDLQIKQIIKTDQSNSLLSDIKNIINDLDFSSDSDFILPDTNISMPSDGTDYGRLDSLENYINSINVDDLTSDSIFSISSNAIDTTLNNYKNLFSSDSGVAKLINDSLDRLISYLDLTKLGGGGGCPSLLMKPFSFNINGIVFDSPQNLGHYFCDPIILGTSFFVLARTVIRIAVSISCFMFIFYQITKGD